MIYTPYSKLGTSKKAAKEAKNLANGHATVLYDALVDAGKVGATAQELNELTGISGDSIRPRLIYLEREGFAKRTDKTRRTKSGRDAEVWVVASVQPKN